MSYYPKTWHFSTSRHSEGAWRRFFQVSPTGRKLQEELHLIWQGNALMSVAKQRNIWNLLTNCPCHLTLDKRKKMGGWVDGSFCSSLGEILVFCSLLTKINIVYDTKITWFSTDVEELNWLTQRPIKLI